VTTRSEKLIAKGAVRDPEFVRDVNGGPAVQIHVSDCDSFREAERGDGLPDESDAFRAFRAGKRRVRLGHGIAGGGLPVGVGERLLAWGAALLAIAGMPGRGRQVCSWASDLRNVPKESRDRIV
jgi:hypothetical protein